MLSHLAQVGDVHRSSLVRPVISSLGTDEGVVVACGLELKKILWLVPGQCVCLHIEDTRYMRYYNAKIEFGFNKE